MKNQYKILLLVLVLAGLAVLILTVNSKKKTISPLPDSQNDVLTDEDTDRSTLPIPVKQKVEHSKLPNGFPENLYMAEDAVITANYNNIFPDKRIWGIRSYETELDGNTLQKNYQAYLDTLWDWTKQEVYNSISSEDIVLFADKGQNSLTMVIGKGESKQSRIQITLTAKQ